MSADLVIVIELFLRDVINVWKMPIISNFDMDLHHLEITSIT